MASQAMGHGHKLPAGGVQSSPPRLLACLPKSLPASHLLHAVVHQALDDVTAQRAQRILH